MSNVICGKMLGLGKISCDLPAGHSGDHQAQVDAHGNSIRSVKIDAANAEATFLRSFNKQNIFLLDPDKPKVDANSILTERGGKMLDPKAMNHNCPFCNKTMAWDLFIAHAEACFKRWRKVVYRKKRMLV